MCVDVVLCVRVSVHRGGQTTHSAGGVYKETNPLRLNFYSPIILTKVMLVCYIIL